MLAIASFMFAENHNTKTAETHWNLFGFKNKNNLIDLIENSKRHVPVGEVLMIRKLKCKNHKFSPGLTFIGFMANMTLLTEMTRMTGMTGIIRTTGMTEMTRMIGMTRMTWMTGITRITGMTGMTGMTGKNFQTCYWLTCLNTGRTRICQTE